MITALCPLTRKLLAIRHHDNKNVRGTGKSPGKPVFPYFTVKRKENDMQSSSELKIWMIFYSFFVLCLQWSFFFFTLTCIPMIWRRENTGKRGKKRENEKGGKTGGKISEWGGDGTVRDGNDWRTGKGGRNFFPSPGAHLCMTIPDQRG